MLFPGFGGEAPHLQSKEREKHPGKEVGSWHCELILLYSEAGFLVAFGSTGCSGSVGWTCTVRAVGASVECRRHELLGGSRDMPPGKFPAFFGPELGKRKSLLRR